MHLSSFKTNKRIATYVCPFSHSLMGLEVFRNAVVCRNSLQRYKAMMIIMTNEKIVAPNSIIRFVLVGMLL